MAYTDYDGYIHCSRDIGSTLTVESDYGSTKQLAINGDYTYMDCWRSLGSRTYTWWKIVFDEPVCIIKHRSALGTATWWKLQVDSGGWQTLYNSGAISAGVDGYTLKTSEFANSYGKQTDYRWYVYQPNSMAQAAFLRETELYALKEGGAGFFAFFCEAFKNRDKWLKKKGFLIPQKKILKPLPA